MKKKTYKNEAYEVLKEIDTLNFVTKSSTREQREQFRIGDIYINAAVCEKCKDYIRSKHVHDHQTCKCGECSVDGGSHYVKRRGPCINIIEKFYDSDNRCLSIG